MKIKKSAVYALKPTRALSLNGIVGNADKMNRRIKRNMAITEQKIASGIKRAERMEIK